MEYKFKKNLKIRTCYVYKDSIERVFNVLTDNPSMFSLFKDHSKNMHFSKGKGFSEEGSILEFNWKDLFNIKIKVEHIFDGKNEKRLFLHGYKVIPLNITYWTNYLLYRSTCDNYTVLIFEDVAGDNKSFSIIDEAYTINEKLSIGKQIKNILKNNTINLFQEESLVINIDIEYVWKVITDWEIFKLLVPSIGEHIEYEGKSTKIGSYLTIKFENYKNYNKLRVIKSNINGKFREYDLEYVDGIPKNPLQIIQFKLIVINKNCTYLSFKHDFKEPVSFESIVKLGTEKQKILSILKNKLESEEE
jgi:hypothetical protein